MADMDGDLSLGDDIDIDRVIIDPDYRRVVIALLRQTRSSTEPVPAEASPAGRRPD